MLSKALFWGGALIAAAGITIVTAPGLGYETWGELASETGWAFLQSELAWGIGYCGLAAVCFAAIAITRREHPTMVSLSLLALSCVVPFFVVGLGFIGLALVAIYLIFSIFRR